MGGYFVYQTRSDPSGGQVSLILARNIGSLRSEGDPFTSVERVSPLAAIGKPIGRSDPSSYPESRLRSEAR